MTRFDRLVYAAIFFLVMPKPAHAYLDPGTGSMLLYAIIGISAALLYSIKGVIFKMAVMARGRGKTDSLAALEADIIFHSEGRQYDHLFLPILEQIDTESIAYITQYSRENLPPLPQGVKHFSIGSSAVGFSALNRVKGRLLVTTTPQLGVMMFKRSKKVGHYCHLVHSPTDIAFYKPYAFDHFDSVLCPGPFMEKSIRHLETLRHQPPKKLFNTGVVYYDAMKAAAHDAVRQQTSETERKSCVLIAPSWGANSLFVRWGCEFLNELPDDFDVIVRPHPQIKISQKEIFDQLEPICEERGFALDCSPSASESMARSDIMISDFSGIVYDYAFVYQKPLLIAELELKKQGFEANFLPKPLWDEEILKKLASIVKSEDVANLPKLIREKISDSPDSVTALRDQSISHFGSAVPAAIRQLRQILSEQEAPCSTRF